MKIVPIEDLNKNWLKNIPASFFGLEKLGFALAFKDPPGGSDFWGLWLCEDDKAERFFGGWIVFLGREAVIDGKKEPWFFDSEYFNFNINNDTASVHEEMLKYSSENPVVLVFLTNDDIAYGMRFTSENEALYFLSSFEDVTQMIEKVGSLLETHNG